MKKLFVIFSLVFCVSGWGQSFQINDFQSIQDRAKSEQLSNAKSLALDLLSEGSQSLNSRGAALANQVKQKLYGIGFKEPRRETSTTSCPSSRQMFVNFNFLSDVFICPNLYTQLYNFFDTAKSQVEALAQLLIHESTHLVQAKRDECTATELEIRVMSGTSVGVKSWSNVDRYSNECDFSWIK